jgi:alpha-tubulin suppressor-like RCC1 family protein
MKRLVIGISVVLIGFVLIQFGAMPTQAAPNCAPVCVWGGNQFAQLGNGTITSSTTAVPLTVVNNVVAIAGSQYHSLALKSDGTVWAWGLNNLGQLGNGTISGATTATPLQVTGLTGASAIAIGYYHSLALKSDGTVWTWGYNNHGQLGNGTTANSTVPMQVVSLSGVVAIASGQYHSLALKSDGTVWAWGWGQYGQLGNGTVIDALTPVPVSGLTGVTAIAAGAFHSLALKTDGTVWGWGNNISYQLGNNTGTNSATPVQAGLSNVTAISGGALHSLALRNDGTVWAWGSNQYGEVGNGTPGPLGRTPAPVIGLSGISAIAAGGQHSLALKNDATVWAWGLNNFGQLGNGATLNANAPVPVSTVYGAVGLAAGVFHSVAFIDTIAPASSSTQTPLSNGAGWNNTDVVVNWNWVDNLGGTGIDPAQCTTTTTSSGEGTLTLAATCQDRAANSRSASYTVKVDKTTPTISVSATKADSTPYNAGSWSNQSVTVHYTCSDSLSGIDTCPADVLVNAEGVTAPIGSAAIDAAGNTSTVSFGPIQIDRIAPDTTITNGPASLNNSSTASVAFISNESNTNFECQLDGSAFTACTTPATFNALADGAHVFTVRAIDQAGNIDGTPATVSWTIDTTPPTTNITSGPALLTNQTAANFVFSSNEAGTFQCSLDQDPAVACVSPWPYSALPDGSHTFTVQAIDLAGYVDPNAATFEWTVDTTEPDTLITSSPTAVSNSGEASIAFFSPKAGATFECSLDGAVFAACDSPQTYLSLPEGSHTFAVKALDGAGNVDATPASFTWIIDMTPGDTVITSGPSPITRDTTATFAFSSSKPGSTFQCSLNGVAFTACASPTSYTLTQDGDYVFAVRSKDVAGNVDPTPDSWSWTIDTTTPQTTLDTMPFALSNSPSVSLGFSSDETGSTFECRLDQAAFDTCSSPLNLNALSDGSHTFEVRATDRAGNIDATPASVTWLIDTVAPTTSITDRPANPVNQAAASFAFASNENGNTFECSLDGSTFNTCSSPLTRSGLGDGPHTFAVKATDAAGNTDPNPATYSWMIDTLPPATTITEQPSANANVTNATFSFTSNEASTFQCELDNGGFAACASPIGYAALTDGGHTFAVRAIDLAGNVDPNPASFNWVVDTVAPDTSLSITPPAVSTSADAAFSFTSAEAGVTFECSLDGATFAICANGDTVAYTGLIDSAHIFNVRAIDRAGNIDATPASFTWAIDTATPATTITAHPDDPTNQANATFTFVSTKAGSTFECRLDNDLFSACVSPQTYTALTDGAHTFAVRSIDTAGHVELQPATFSWAVDTLAPETSLIDHPTVLVNAASATFAFSSSEADGHFVCTLDGINTANCASPITYNNLGEGSHTFAASAVDVAGNVDLTPASFTWAIDTLAPTTTITGQPASMSNSPSASFAFTSNEAGSAFQCSLDAVPFSACASPTSYSGLMAGAHTFVVKAIDPAGNVDPIGASTTWTIDTTPPDTSLVTQPSDPTSSTSATFTFNSTEVGSTFACSLDNAAFATCVSPKAYSGLALGTHTLAVKATDPAGNPDLTPAQYAWTVKSGYAFTGFFKPIANLPKVNKVKAGSLIPVRFSLGGNFGPDVFATGYPQSQLIACSPSAQPSEADVDEVETPGSRKSRFAVGGTGGTGWVIPYYDFDRRTWQYLYLWKTERSWSGTCRQLIIQFNDGSAPQVANFKFVR